MLELCQELILNVANYLDPCSYVDLAICHERFNFLLNPFEWKRLVARSLITQRLVEKMVKFIAETKNDILVLPLLETICQQYPANSQYHCEIFISLSGDSCTISCDGFKLLCHTIAMGRVKQVKKLKIMGKDFFLNSAKLLGGYDHLPDHLSEIPLWVKQCGIIKLHTFTIDKCYVQLDSEGSILASLDLSSAWVIKFLFVEPDVTWRFWTNLAKVIAVKQFCSIQCIGMTEQSLRVFLWFLSGTKSLRMIWKVVDIFVLGPHIVPTNVPLYEGIENLYELL